MDSAPAKRPAHEQAYQDLRERVLYGELSPGQPVTIQGLVGEIGLGTTPVREAIRRLTSQGALVLKGNRRVEVPVLGAAEHRQIGFARLAIEPELARLAVGNLKESDIRALEAVDERVDHAIAQGDARLYLASNHRFHAELYAASGAEVLLALSDMLWLRSGPSLRVMLGRRGTANLPDKHREALVALRAGDAEGVAMAIRGDIEQGIAQVEAGLGAVQI